VRGAQNMARLVMVAVVVVSALTLIALAARSDRTPLLAPKQVAAPTGVITEPTASPTSTSGTGSAGQSRSGSQHQPNWLVWFGAIVAIAPVVIALLFAPAMLYVPDVGLWFGRREPRSAEPAEVDDEVAPPPLVDAVAEGLRELDQGGPGEGVVACWVQLERAAADAGTHRAAPETASELVGRLIDRHPVSSGPLLRLADLYREARYSRHELPESARAEARTALEQLRAQIVSSPVGSR
jgi:Domain of unknown function (DUF4129)